MAVKRRVSHTEGKSNLVELHYEHIIHETYPESTDEGAYLFFFEKDKDAVWIPKAACEVDESKKVLTVSEGLAVEKEIEEYMV